MSQTVDEMQRRLEIWLNEVTADQMVFRTTFQCLLLNLIGATPHGVQMLGDLKGQVLGAIGRIRPVKEAPDGAERHKQLTLMRAEQFFQELESVVGQSENNKEGGKPS